MHFLDQALSACPYSCRFPEASILFCPKCVSVSKTILVNEQQGDLWGGHWRDVWWGSGGPGVLTTEGAESGETGKKRQLLGFPGGPVVRVRLPMWRTWVQSLVREDFTGLGATKPSYHNYWACALESVLCNKRSYCNEEPEHCNWRVAPPHWNQRKPSCSNKDPAQLK